MKLEIIKTIPHDEKAYTQGYFFKDNFLYESTGLYGHSSLRKINVDNGEIIKKINIDKKYFSEGIEFYKEKIYMLTWREQVCKVFDMNTFEEINQHKYSGEGWGITLFKNQFYMSDGSNRIKIIDPESFRLIDDFEIYYKNTPVHKLNELQNFKELLLANIWYKDEIISILDKTTVDVLNLSFLRKYLKNQKSEVMNGIAYDKIEDVLYVTGKFWDLSFKIKLYE